jgi:hypothetical protein
LTDAANVYAGVDQFRGNLECARRRIGILKRASISGNGDIQIFSDVAIERQLLALNQLEKDLSCSGRVRIDIDKIAVTGIALVVIDVDPSLGRSNSVAGGSKSALDGSL